MVKPQDNNNSAEIKFLVTMHMAYNFLQTGTISADEYAKFLARMNKKYPCENVRKLYQSMLDIYRNQSVNSDTKGATIHGNNKASIEKETSQ